MPPSPTLYQLLQVDRNAEPAIIRSAYRFLAAMSHPENIETGNPRKFREFTEAWRILSDDGKRSAYDLELANENYTDPPFKNAVFFQCLQVDPEAHPTIIRLAYKYLASKYHPETGEIKDALMYQKILDAWSVIGTSD